MEVLPLVEVLGVPPLARCSAASAGAAASELRRASFRWSDCSYATSFVSALWFYCAPTLSAADVPSQQAPQRCQEREKLCLINAV